MGVVPNALNTIGTGLGNPLSPDNCAANGSRLRRQLRHLPLQQLAVREPGAGSQARQHRRQLPLQAERQRRVLRRRLRVAQRDHPAGAAFAVQQQLPVDRPGLRNAEPVPGDHRLADQPVLPVGLAGRQRPGRQRPAGHASATAPSTAATASPRTPRSRRTWCWASRGNVKGYDYDVAYTHNSSDVTERALQGYQNQTELVEPAEQQQRLQPAGPSTSRRRWPRRSTAPTTSVR